MRWLLATGICLGWTAVHLQAQSSDPRPTTDNPVPALMPTSPQSPMPQPGNVGWMNRPAAGDARIMPDASYGSSCAAGGQSCQTCTGGGPPKNIMKKVKDWICFCPTAGDGLPLLRVHPYIGPWTGTFMCGSPPASFCGSGKCGKGGIVTPEQLPGANYPPTLPSREAVPATPSAGGQPKSSLPRVPLMPEGTDTDGKAPEAMINYPPRGCQGGVISATNGLFPPSAEVIDMSLKQQPLRGIESIDYRGKDLVSTLPPWGVNRNFIAAVPMSRQMLTPIEVIVPSSTLP